MTNHESYAIECYAGNGAANLTHLKTAAEASVQAELVGQEATDDSFTSAPKPPIDFYSAEVA